MWILRSFCWLLSLLTLSLAALGADPLDHWQRRQSGFALNLLGVAHGAGRFVAVGQSGVVLISPTGLQWTTTASNLSPNLRCVAYGADTFVAAGDTGALLTSTDGVNWTARDSTTTNSLHSVRWLGDRFMATGERGTLLSSADGLTWVQHVSGSLQTLTAVARKQDTFVAVAGNSSTGVKFPISSNGIEWVNQAFPYNSFYGIAADATRFVALGIRGSVYHSTNGQTWNSIFSTINSEYNFAITHTHGRFVSVGGPFGGGGQKIVSSPDGLNWKLHPIDTGHSGTLRAVAYGGLTLVAVGEKGLIIQSAPFLQLSAGPRNPFGLRSLLLSTDAGVTCRLQSASTPTGPDWTDVTNFISTGESITIVDPAAANAPARFYRAVSP